MKNTSKANRFIVQSPLVQSFAAPAIRAAFVVNRPDQSGFKSGDIVGDFPEGESPVNHQQDDGNLENNINVIRFLFHSGSFQCSIFLFKTTEATPETISQKQGLKRYVSFYLVTLSGTLLFGI